MRLARLIEVIVYLRNGSRIAFTCSELTKTFKGDELTGLQADDAPDWPFYLRLDDISAIRTNKLWRWRLVR